MASKIGRNKKACEKYRQSGRKALNKIAKQERAKKREERFAKRREEGKKYTYKPNPYEPGTREYREEKRIRASKNVDHRTEYQQVRSIMDRVAYEVAKEKAEMKAALAAKKKNKTKVA